MHKYDIVPSVDMGEDNILDDGILLSEGAQMQATAVLASSFSKSDFLDFLLLCLILISQGISDIPHGPICPLPLSSPSSNLLLTVLATWVK